MLVSVDWAGAMGMFQDEQTNQQEVCVIGSIIRYAQQHRPSNKVQDFAFTLRQV